MLTPDDERTLQVLEAVATHSDALFPMRDWLKLESEGMVVPTPWYKITDAGRARLAELREKKGRVI